MRIRPQRLLCTVFSVGLIASACASQPASIIAGAGAEQGDDEKPVEAADTPQDARELIGVTETSPSLIQGTLWSEHELSSLRGTAWVVFAYNGELADDASLSFWWVEDEGLHVAYLDDCTSGSALLTGKKRRGRWVLDNDDMPQQTCPGHPSELFHAGNSFEFQYRAGQLTISTDDGHLRTEHWQSTSIHDEQPAIELDAVPTTPIPDLPLPNLSTPDVESLSDIPEVVDLPFSECASSGRAGIEPNPRLRERLAWAEALQRPLSELPFISSYSGGAGLHHQELSVGLSVRYGPSLEWLEEHIPQGIICLEVPRLGYYQQPDARVTWQLPRGSEALDPSATDVQVETTSCRTITVADIVYLDEEIQLVLTEQRAPAGVMTPSIACQQIIDIELDEPIGARTLVSRP